MFTCTKTYYYTQEFVWTPASTIKRNRNQNQKDDCLTRLAFSSLTVEKRDDGGSLLPSPPLFLNFIDSSKTPLIQGAVMPAYNPTQTGLNKDKERQIQHTLQDLFNNSSFYEEGALSSPSQGSSPHEIEEIPKRKEMEGHSEATREAIENGHGQGGSGSEGETGWGHLFQRSPLPNAQTTSPYPVPPSSSTLPHKPSSTPRAHLPSIQGCDPCQHGPQPTTEGHPDVKEGGVVSSTSTLQGEMKDRSSAIQQECDEVVTTVRMFRNVAQETPAVPFVTCHGVGSDVDASPNACIAAVLSSSEEHKYRYILFYVCICLGLDWI